MTALFFSTVYNLSGQEEIPPSNNLRDVWAEMLKSSETYQEYKIIKLTKLAAFRNAMGDSLSAYSNSIDALNTDKAKIMAELKATNSELAEVKILLTEMEKVDAEIAFLGLGFKKTTYNVMVWSIVVLLVVLIFTMYVKIARVVRKAKRIKTSYSTMNDEYRSFKFEAKENQIKIKRELQTALNKLDVSR